jgi:multicomponent Na+:H+ antiporter subunit B
MKKVLATVFISALAVLLVYVVTLLPPMGHAENPTNQHVVPRYLEQGEQEAGTRNIVAGVVLNYRGYDTMGEVAIFSAALAGIFAVLGGGRKKIGSAFIDRSVVGFSFISGTAAVLMIPFIILFAVYVIIYGLDLPGGGFQGGAAIGAGIMISTVTFGFRRVQRRLSHHVRMILEGSAISAFFIVGTVAVAFGASFLTYTLPGLSSEMQATTRAAMLAVVQFGIGIKVGMICTSILLALLREEEAYDVEHAD